MEWRWVRRALRAAASHKYTVPMAALGALALAGCDPNARPGVAAAQPRGATVAFESIDGPPPAQFQKLVQDLNDEAQARRLAVMSRENTSAYRVRGYLAAEVAKNKTTISWVWDVFDRDRHRSLRISGAETVNGRHRDAWQVADEAMLKRIAQSSMDQLAAFLTSPEVAPGTPNASPQMTLASLPDTGSPEAAGIFRIFQPHADPVPEQAAPAPAAAAEPIPTAVAVPLPPRRPTPVAAAAPRDALMVAAARRTTP